MECAKEEFLEHVGERSVLCAVVVLGWEYSNTPQVKYVLKRGFTESDFINFLNLLNFEYDSGFGSQQLFGTIWYTDGTYSDRKEHGGSEWWERQKVPNIPEECY